MRVYIAGKLNDNASDYIRNLHNMIREAEEVRRKGFAVFVPGLDFIMGVVLGNWEYEDYFNNSQPWLNVSDAVYVTPGWETSKGTAREIERAKQKGIPIFFNLEDLIKYKNENE